jgi:hypothetical protein
MIASFGIDAIAASTIAIAPKTTPPEPLFLAICDLPGRSDES